MDFLILGPLEVSDGGRALALGGPKQRAVLAHLILRANLVVPADLLIDDLWGEEPPETARATLQTYVYRLRKVLGDDRIEGSGRGYVLHAEPGEIDAGRFESLVKDAKAHLPDDAGRAATLLADALTLWRGAPLADLGDEASLRGDIARLEELRLSATEHRISAEIAMGAHSTVVSELESLTAHYPLRERMWANLMLALYRSGRQAEALASFERARGVLVSELGADPSPELRRLHEQILHQDPALGAAEPARPPVRQSRMDMPPGTEFAGYRIERVLGRGGMSVVYLAEHIGLQRKVALKVLAPQLAEDERFRERFVRESRLAASIDHPNVIPIYEAGEGDGELFIAMRYVQGTDLRTRLQDGPLEPARAASIVRQVAAALDAAHEQGLVHRDVKPANVLLARARGSDATEHVYLSDFGLTKRSASDSGITGTGQFVGTLDYAAPEQFQGGTPDARTDVYSLGCVLFESLSGRPPFRAENDASIMYAHLQQEAPKLSTDRSGLPPEIDTVVSKALAKAPDARQQSAGELAEAASSALGLAAELAGAGRSPSGWSKWRAPIGALAAALIAGIVVFSISRGETPAAEGTGGSTPRVIPSPAPEPNFRTIDRALSPDEERLLTYIPEGVGSECLPLDREEPVQGELAALVCRTTDIEVLYELFPTRDRMDDAFQGNANSTGATEGDCATEHLAMSSYTIGGKPSGRVLCYTVEPGAFTTGEPDQSHIEWTEENGLIYAHAVRNDLGDLSLYEWWLSSAGPAISADGGQAALAKDPPASAGPALRDGSYLISLTERETAQGGIGTSAGDTGRGTWAIHLEDGAYQLLKAGTLQDGGRTYLRKPNLIVFDPTNCPHGSTEANVLRPAVFEWSASGHSVSWEKVSGGPCAGPQRFPHRPWTRTPSELIAFESGSDIALMDAGGFVVKKLTSQAETHPNISPAWSPDGSRIVFAGAGQEGFDLYVMNADGTDLTRLTEMPGDETQPAWAPDESDRIAFVYDDLGSPDHRTSIVVVGADGTGRTELLSRENQDAYSPAWSPDGDRIAFSVFGGFALEHRHELFVMDADGSNLTKVREEPDFAPMSWTPDGKRLVFWGEGHGGPGLLSMHPDGSNIRAFVGELPFDAKSIVLDWSSDEGWIVMSGRNGVDDNNVYLMRADGSDVFHLTGGIDPRWRPKAG